MGESMSDMEFENLGGEEEDMETDDPGTSETPDAPKRGRGRPRKSLSSPSSGEEWTSSSTTDRRRTRQTKHVLRKYFFTDYHECQVLDLCEILIFFKNVQQIIVIICWNITNNHDYLLKYNK